VKVGNDLDFRVLEDSGFQIHNAINRKAQETILTTCVLKKSWWQHGECTDHVKMLLRAFFTTTSYTWWWWTGFSTSMEFSKTLRNSASETATRHRCCRTASVKAAKHKTFHQYFTHYARQ